MLDGWEINMVILDRQEMKYREIFRRQLDSDFRQEMNMVLTFGNYLFNRRFISHITYTLHITYCILHIHSMLCFTYAFPTSYYIYMAYFVLHITCTFHITYSIYFLLAETAMYMCGLISGRNSQKSASYYTYYTNCRYC